MRVGVDIDGVLANYVDGYTKRLIQTSGRNLFPENHVWNDWDYDKVVGYASDERTAARRSIQQDSTFWRNLFPYGEASSALRYLANIIQVNGDDVYFITDRPGFKAKTQTEDWLRTHTPGLWAPNPTVLISSAKGECAHALNLDVYIDDKPENCIDVVDACGSTRVFLMDRPWNRHAEIPAVSRVSSVVGICDPSVATFAATPGSAIR